VIDLTKRESISIDEFRNWLHKLIQDKKGAIPDLNDWKLIKEQLDKVGKRTMDDGSGYSILQSDDDEYAFACGGAEPYDMQFTIDLLDRLCDEAEQMYNVENRDGLHNQFYDEYAHSRGGIKYKEYDDGQTKTEYGNDGFYSNT
jgi:hypothetical protein